MSNTIMVVSIEVSVMKGFIDGYLDLSNYFFGASA